MQTAAGLWTEAGNSLERMRELDRFGIHGDEIGELATKLAQRRAAHNRPPAPAGTSAHAVDRP
jgi:hypothetical protein